jgi:hypothetical protein
MPLEAIRRGRISELARLTALSTRFYDLKDRKDKT